MRSSPLRIAPAPCCLALLASLAGGSLFAAPAATPASPALQLPEALVAEGLPPIPATLPDELRRYTESRSAGLADWHPTRRELLISTRFADAAQIHQVATPGGARRQLTFFDEPISVARFGPRDGSFFVFLQDRGGDEFAQIYRHDLADGTVTLLTDGGRSQHGSLRFSRAGDRLAYTTTRRNGSDRDVHVVDPRDPRSDRRVGELSGGGWAVLDWAHDDRSLLLAERLSVNRSHLWILELASGKLTRVTPVGDEEVAYGDAAFLPGDTTVVTSSDRGREFSRLVRLEVASGGETPLGPELDWGIQDLELSPDGATVAFLVNRAGISTLHLLDLGSGAARDVGGLPVGVVGGLRWRSDASELGFSVNSARSPSDVWSVDARTLALTRWTESELGGLVAERLVEPELVRWKSFDGREISGFLSRPDATRFPGPRPVIVSIHGGPESQARPTFKGRWNYVLEELGVALVEPNVRGSTGYGKSFSKLDNGVLREDSVKDIGALLDLIAADPGLDASRVLVMGGSYGGYMTLATAFHYPERIRGAIDRVGISHFTTFLESTESYRRDLRRVEYGDERDPAMRAFFERIAPLHNAAKITQPLFVVQGANDPRVPRGEAEQIVARVRANGVPVWYLLATDEGHGFKKKANSDAEFYATILFLREVLLGPAAAP